MVFVCRSPSQTPTGRYLGCAHVQRLLREAPFELVAGVVDTDMPRLSPDATLGEVTRYFAAYNLVAGPVVDSEDHLLGAVTVDDVLDHLLPVDWRDRLTEPEDGGEEPERIVVEREIAAPEGTGRSSTLGQTNEVADA
jgi:CBS domain-containing protein